MKKFYESPVFVAEAYAVSNSIAKCDIDIDTTAPLTIEKGKTILCPVRDGGHKFSEKGTIYEKKLGVSMLMKIALSVLVVASLIISISCLMQANQLRREAEELQAEVDNYNDRIKKLKYYLEKEVDDEYIAKYAREYLNMYFPDEEIYYQDVND